MIYRLGAWTHTLLISAALWGVLSSAQRSGSDYPHLSGSSLSEGSCNISGRFMSAVPGHRLQDYWVWPYAENSTCAFEPTCPTKAYKMLLSFQPSANLTVTVTGHPGGAPLGETKPFVWSNTSDPTALLFPHSAARVEFAATGSGGSSELFSLICLRTPVDSAPLLHQGRGTKSYPLRRLLRMSSGAQELSSPDAGGNVTRGWLFICPSEMDLIITLHGAPPRDVDLGLVDGTTGVDIHPAFPVPTYPAHFMGVAMLTAVFPAGYVDRSGFLLDASCVDREPPRPATFPSMSAERKSKGVIVAAVVVPLLLLPAIVVGVVLCYRRLQGQRVRKLRQSQQQQHEGFAEENDDPTSPSKAKPNGNVSLRDPTPAKGATLVAELPCVGCRVAQPSFALVGCGHVVVCACCAASMLGMPCPICGVVCLGIAPWIPNAGSWENPHPSPAVHSGIVVLDEPRTPYGAEQRCDDCAAPMHCPTD